jgi:hypothetical protein
VQPIFLQMMMIYAPARDWADLVITEMSMFPMGRYDDPVAALETWLREQRRKPSARNEIAKAIQYSLNRWTALIRSSTMAACACRTTPPSGRCVATIVAILSSVSPRTSATSTWA